MSRVWKPRNVLKWTGTCLCVLVLILAGVNLWWGVGWASPRMDVCLGSSCGCLTVAWTNHGLGTWVGMGTGPGWSVQRVNNSWTDLRGWGEFATLPRCYGAAWPMRYVTLPLWIVLLLAGVPAALLWWQDPRRIPLGHCRCGYDLTGNVSGHCPECGTAVEPAPSGRATHV
jgi:hypothetical protein